jgi:hypothetical protein
MDTEHLVRIEESSPGGPYFVVLGGDALPEARIGPETNPAIAREIARDVTAFLKGVIAALPGCTTTARASGDSKVA